MGAKRCRNDDVSVLANGKRLDSAFERESACAALERIICRATEKPVDFLRKAPDACIERCSIDLGLSGDVGDCRCAGAIALENNAQGDLYGYTVFSV